MACSRRKFVKNVGTVMLFSAPLVFTDVNATENPRKRTVRYAMLSNEGRCQGCHLCTLKCEHSHTTSQEGSILLSTKELSSLTKEDELRHYFDEYA